MWRIILGVLLSALPRRWRAPSLLEQPIPWERCAILSGLLESLLALLALVSWYSHSVTTWAANALDSALRGGPEASVPGQAIGFSALVLWCLHPLTWFIAYFVIEGVVRFLAAVSAEQILPSWPLAISDWTYGKLMHRQPEGDALHTPTARQQLRSLASTVKLSAKTAGLQDLPDELIEWSEDADLLLEIRSSRAKPEWVPPKVVRIGVSYYRLESNAEGPRPRPFVYRLRRLAAGVPGRHVLLYEPPRAPEGIEPS